MRLSAPIYRLKRQAKHLARKAGIPLHEALNRIARDEGFPSWSLLAARRSGNGPAARLLAALAPGELILLGARPDQGKTLLGLELAIMAAQTRRQGFFFTLDYHAGDVLGLMRSLDVDPAAIAASFVLDTSDDICADYIIERLGEPEDDALVVIDYLQLLDQRRRNAELGMQISALKSFARRSGVIIVAVSQIDRSFDPGTKRLPELADVRLPNPLDLSLFDKTCFLHDGEMQLTEAA